MNIDVEFREKYVDIIGIDEAGRGPLAGPVVSCAVKLDADESEKILKELDFLDDSKKLSHAKHRIVYEYVRRNRISYGIGMATESEIDTMNILNATSLSMKRAVMKLKSDFEMALVDGKNLKLNFENTQIVGGDSSSCSIAVASNVAKYVRDNILIGMSKLYPLFSFERHKGYGTKDHIEKIRKNGVLPFHRLTFRPVTEIIETEFLNTWRDNKIISEERFEAILRKKSGESKKEDVYESL